MMRRSIFLLIFGVSWLISEGQPGNEWIKYDQEYFGIPTAADAICRLTYSDLQNAGFPVTTTDPRALQVFHRGVEQDIHIRGEDDGVFGPGDYLEFYGRRNDGTLDSRLYSVPANQPHKYYNLYSDTTCFFLTFDPFMAHSSHRMDSVTEENTGGIPAETYHHDEKLLILRDTYSGGHSEIDLLTDSDFVEGEGWTGLSIPNGQFREYALDGITGGYPAAGGPQLEIMVVGRGSQPHRFEVYAGASPSSLRSLGTHDFSGYSAITLNETLAWNDIGADGTMTIRISTLGDAATYDRVSLSYAKLRYPQETTGNDQDTFFRLRPNPADKSYLEIPDLPAQARLYDVTDADHPLRISNPAEAIIPNTSSERILLASVSTPTPPVSRVTFTRIDPTAYDYIIISHKLLMKPAAGYSDAVQAYADYRASEEGGSFRPLVVEVSQLYNQFNYGEVSSLAIRRFMQYLAAGNVPKYLFIIGEDLDIWYDYYRIPQQFNNFKSLVPTAGYPGSDAYYTYNMAGATDMPAVPTGRITAMKPEEVAAYLNKVREMESLPYNALWRKNILHLSGGIHPGEPERFRDYLGDFQKIAEGYHLGGSVKWVAKQSTNPVEFVNIDEEVNSGLNLITFYGHSASSVIDFDIGFVTDPKLGYENKGRYPMFLINGCNAGSFFINAKLFGEDWINAENKGAVGFIAHTSYGLESTLRYYSEIFYRVAYGDSTFVRQGIGDIQKEVARRYMQSVPRTVSNLSQVEQMLLLGDPAVKLFGANKPDYEIREENVIIESFNEDPVTAFSDSIAMQLIVPNFGMALEDTLHVRVTRTFADNSTVAYDTLFPPVRYSDTLTFVLRKENTFGAGSNSFTIELDPDNAIPELNENNNAVGFDYVIPLNRTKNLFPHDFAIVNTQLVNLTFQSTDVMSDTRGYLLEVDTVNTFDSPFKASFDIQGTVLNRRQLPLLGEDSLTYYWRTRFADQLPEESQEWEMNSFTFIENGPEGWAQIHFPQYLENQSVGLVKDAEARLLDFEETVTSIFIKNFGAAQGSSRLDVSVKLNGTEYQINTQQKACRVNTINLIAFEKVTTVPYAPVPIKFQDFRTCGRQPQVINSFRLNEFYGVDPDTGEPAGMATMVDNVQPGDSVVMFSIGNAGYSLWPDDVKTKLGELGISTAQINALQDGQPVVIFGKKGTAPGSAKILVSEELPLNKQTLEISGSVSGGYNFGNMTSTLIGPAQEWHSLIPKIGPAEANDEVFIDLVGVGIEGNTTLLMSGINTTADLSAIDAAAYPYLRLVYNAKDDLNLTPVQLESWMISYTTMAEGLIFYQGVREAVHVQEGESWTGHYGFVNISEKAFPDSLDVRLDVFNKATRRSEESYSKIKSPAPGDTTLFESIVETRNMIGVNDLDVYVNPRIVPEQYYDNNLLKLPDQVHVAGDQFDPVVEVTLDGRVLADGDFVSPNPEIRIRLWDENRNLLKLDTAGVRIFLEYPCESGNCPGNPVIYFSRDDVEWHPATDTTDFLVVFAPEGLPEGTYQLTVEAGDATGNMPGSSAYTITFQVSYESSVVFLAPYPNPSASSMLFTLVISGQEPPDHLAIRIFSISGRLVREIRRAGEIFVGTNEILWDGTSDTGEYLPGGVYPYRIVLQRNGSEIPIKVPVNTSYFRGGYGKVVLIR